MRLISVTRENAGSKVFVNVDKICAIYPYYGKEDITVIQFAGNYNYLTVAESPEEIVDMIKRSEG